ncbi:MAG: DNA-binding protein WhiA [Clostridiales bacterium]|nr:DNA-binding protein WhiA [Clostridiales bacterium]
MSFSSRVKDELSRQLSPARHCRIAEIAAIISLCGRVQISAEDSFRLRIQTENPAVARKCFTLLKKTFNIDTDISVRRGVENHQSRIYLVVIRRHEDAIRVLQATKLIDQFGEIEENLSLAQNVVIMKTCCKRAFIRGAFLAAGSISDPERFYHFEIACSAEGKAIQLQGLLGAFGLDARIVQRKKYYVVYIKEGGQIVDVLNVMEAPVSLMELENIRILREMRGSVNRKVNCETANINKTVSAAVRQMEDIMYIRDTVGFGTLPENLQDIARLRLSRPEATLKELGESLDPPVGKSGVNHRLRKLGDLAQKLREQRQDTGA